MGVLISRGFSQRMVLFRRAVLIGFSLEEALGASSINFRYGLRVTAPGSQAGPVRNGYSKSGESWKTSAIALEQIRTVTAQDIVVPLAASNPSPG